MQVPGQRILSAKPKISTPAGKNSSALAGVSFWQNLRWIRLPGRIQELWQAYPFGKTSDGYACQEEFKYPGRRILSAKPPMDTPAGKNSRALAGVCFWQNLRWIRLRVRIQVAWQAYPFGETSDGYACGEEFKYLGRRMLSAKPQMDTPAGKNSCTLAGVFFWQNLRWIRLPGRIQVPWQAYPFGKTPNIYACREEFKYLGRRMLLAKLQMDTPAGKNSSTLAGVSFRQPPKFLRLPGCFWIPPPGNPAEIFEKTGGLRSECPM